MATDTSQEYLLELKNVSKSFPGVKALDKVNLKLRPGSVHALCGENGAGKSTLIKVINGIYKMDEIFQICDEITILRDGQWIHSCRADEIDKDGIITKMVGREITEQFPKEQVPIGDVVLELRNVSGGRFQNVSFKVRAGEIVGFAGLVGAGRSELFRAVFGLDPLKEGSVFLEGKQVAFRNVRQAIDAGVLMASEDRKREGVVLCRPIRENIVLANLKSICTNGGFLNFGREKQKIQEMIEKLSIKLASPESPVASLSGGNQQKVVLAKWLLRSPKVLILDEPTRGIDVGAKYEIYRLMVDLARQGVAIVMISSEMPEILGMSDRVMIMSQGKLTGELSRDEATQEKVMEFAVRGFES